MLPQVNLIETDQGRFLVMAGEDAISTRLARGEGWEKPLVDLAATIVRNSACKTVIDVGANLGAFTVPIALALPESPVHAFEAQRIVYYQLCGNVFANSLDNVLARNVALTSPGGDGRGVEVPRLRYQGQANIGGFTIDPLAIQHRGYFGGGALEPGETETIEARTLDSFAIGDVGFIKIDVEGHELEVLDGARDTLRRSGNPSFCFEVWTEEDCPWFADKRRRIIAAVLGLGYDIYAIGDFCLAQHRQARFRLTLEGCTHIV